MNKKVCGGLESLSHIKKQQSNKCCKIIVMKNISKERPPKQTTLFIDADLYEALVVRKARGKGSIKDQVNESLRRTLRMRKSAELEEQERRGWEAKPWNEPDEAEVKMWEGTQVLGEAYEE